LDGVRALAVLAVVSYHLGTTGGPGSLRGGFLGVDVFFVLSGYLITSLLIVEARQTGRISIRQFYVRRAKRLLPALYALLLVVGAVGALWLPQQAAKLRADLLSALGYATNWWLIVDKASYFGGGDRPRLLTHLWSLAVEEQYYVVWPIVLIVFAKIRARRSAMLTILTFAVAGSAVAAAALYNPWGDPSRVYYGTDTRALAPLIGAALAVAVRPWRHRDSASPARRAGLDALGVTALAGLTVTAVLLRDTDPLLYRAGFVVIALLAAGLVAVAGHPASVLGRILGGQPLRWLGERSYAVYLWHWPVCALTRPGIDVPLTGWANSAARVAASLVLAELSYRFVERPIRSHGFFKAYPSRHALRRPRLRLPAVRAAALAALVAAGATTIGFQLSAGASRPVDRVPVDAGPAPTLGPLDGTAPPSTGPSPSAGPASARPSGGSNAPSLAVFGDSQGMTLLVNKPADLGKYFATTDATIEGCGVLLGKVASRSGERRDLNASCANWRSKWESSAAKLKPRIALVMIGAWDVFDLTTSTGTLTFGSPQWDANFSAALAQGVAALRKSGATVALSLLPCYRPVKASAGFWPERGDDDRTRHVNTLLKAAAAADAAHVHTIEPPTEFCTNPTIATSRSYRWDGVHYYKPGAALYFKAVVPQLRTML
jgi:peptidoglycan/LPS O-acetylase OafA/YrhL